MANNELNDRVDHCLAIYTVNFTDQQTVRISPLENLQLIYMNKFKPLEISFKLKVSTRKRSTKYPSSDR